MIVYRSTSTQVDATILEVGIGGTYDSTNIVPKPLVTGVTALGIDHVAILGKTLPEIASQKAGIFKVSLMPLFDACNGTEVSVWKGGSPALVSPQPDDAMNVLRARADELKVRYSWLPFREQHH